MTKIMLNVAVVISAITFFVLPFIVNHDNEIILSIIMTAIAIFCFTAVVKFESSVKDDIDDDEAEDERKEFLE